MIAYERRIFEWEANYNKIRALFVIGGERGNEMAEVLMDFPEVRR